jgi:hypothetical protein
MMSACEKPAARCTNVNEGARMPRISVQCTRALRHRRGALRNPMGALKSKRLVKPIGLRLKSRRDVTEFACRPVGLCVVLVA